MKDNKLVDMYIVQDSDKFWGLPYMDVFHEERLAFEFHVLTFFVGYRGAVACLDGAC